MKYRKKPVVIEAFKYLTDEVPEWWKRAEGITINLNTRSAFIPTLEGTHEAKPGDYIILEVLDFLRLQMKGLHIYWSIVMHVQIITAWFPVNQKRSAASHPEL